MKRGFNNNKELTNEPLEFEKTPWVIGNCLRGWQIDVPDNHVFAADVNAFFEFIKPKLVEKLKNELSELKNLKYQIALKAMMKKERNEGKSFEYSFSCFQE